MSAWIGFDSWRAERDPAFVPKAVAVIGLQLHPPTDGPTFCLDEKAGIGVRAPTAPDHPVAPGRPARREFEYVRTGTVQAIVRQRHRAVEFIELLRQLDRVVPLGQVIHPILDPVRMHCSAAVAVFAYYHPGRFQFHWLPLHASWLSFVEAWFAILSKKCLQRSALADFTAAARAITDFVATYNAHHASPSPGAKASASTNASKTSAPPLPQQRPPRQRPPKPKRR